MAADGSPAGDDTVYTGPGGPDGDDGGDVRCKMRRGDGSEWTVTDLSLAPDGLRVSGYRYVRGRNVPTESRREVLDDELLRPDDRVWCLDRRGSVVWRLASPEAGEGREGAGEGEASWGGVFSGTPGPEDGGGSADGGEPLRG